MKKQFGVIWKHSYDVSSALCPKFDFAGLYILDFDWRIHYIDGLPIGCALTPNTYSTIKQLYSTLKGKQFGEVISIKYEHNYNTI